MKKVILLRYSEIHLKGKNRRFFENKLKSNIKLALKNYDCKVSFSNSRYVVEDFKEELTGELVDRLKCVFGVHSLSIAEQIPTDFEGLKAYFKNYKLQTNTFRVSTNRAKKVFGINSMQISALIGGIVLENNAGAKVDLHNPQTVINIDIRENGNTYIFDNIINAYSGMPVGVSGKGLALLSGGIDSPVAIFKIASRGMQIDAVHFHSFPYTSEQAKQKVLDLAQLLTKYVGKIKVFVVSFTQIQEHIHKNCKEEYMITLMRRFMMRIAEEIATKGDYQALITGENLAQVASQTVESLTSTQLAVKSLPIFRPLIAANKDEIVKIAKEIGTYKTSILPYEDCCTVFLPKNPLIKPNVKKVLLEEAKLDLEALIKEAVTNIEVVVLE
jgi:tRNA uracil 4-sulfurtransferase